jgi:hypothetical protein
VAAWILASSEALVPDKAMARRFLQALDPAVAYHSFRSFSDTPYTRQGGADPLQRAIHGTLDACWRRLVALNRIGAAIAVTVNQSNGHGRRAQDIRRVRALFLDDDRGWDPYCFALTPHIQVITSQGHNHYYWLVRDIDPLEFASYQRRLAGRYGGDARVCALNQAMQLPGFWRRKRVSRPRLQQLRLHYLGDALTRHELVSLLGA